MNENYNSQPSILTDSAPQTRKVLDPIHDFITFDQEIWSCIDTPEFQRLRDIKQLGPLYLVFQGANHTRFEHSLGTAHLARKQFKSIVKHQKLDFDGLGDLETVLRNVTLGGLFHDLGHGPLSHTFDGKFIKMLNPGTTWTHEQASIMMLQKLVDDNHINFEEEDLKMIKDIIDSDKVTQNKNYERTWIFDIVSNKRNSIDVDKFDYMTRDSYHLGLKDTYFDYRNIIRDCRVIEDQICFPIKQVNKIYELFQARYKLYKNIYLHRCSLALEHMFCDILFHANPVYDFEKVITDSSLYLGLSDYIFKEIEKSKDPRLAKSREILTRIAKRELYRFASEILIDRPLPDTAKIKEDIVCCSGDSSLTIDDIYISSGTLNYAFKDKDPVTSVEFYSKGDLTKSMHVDKNQVSLLLPTKFSENYLRVFCSSETKLKIVKEAFKKYCEKILNLTPGPVEGAAPIPSPFKDLFKKPSTQKFRSPSEISDKAEKKVKGQVKEHPYISGEQSSATDGSLK